MSSPYVGEQGNENKQNILRIYLGQVQKLVQPSDGANKKEILLFQKLSLQKSFISVKSLGLGG